MRACVHVCVCAYMCVCVCLSKKSILKAHTLENCFLDRHKGFYCIFNSDDH